MKGCNDGERRDLAGVKHQGTTAYGKRVNKNRNRNKAAKKSRRNNRRK